LERQYLSTSIREIDEQEWIYFVDAVADVILVFGFL
jgi:hypothetical protein